MVVTITDVVSFILRYRKHSNAFKDATKEELEHCIQYAIADNCIVINSDFTGRISGVIVAEKQADYRRLHIVGLLCINGQALKSFAKWLKGMQEYEGFALTAMRRGKMVYYDTEKLLTKLSK